MFKFDWRVTWYGVFVWMVALALSGFVVLPWFYVVFPLVILFILLFYFSKFRYLYGSFFAKGLSVGFLWFIVLFVLDFVQFVGFDASSASVYFLDPRNFIKYPIVILLPAIYGLVLENSRLRNL